MKIKYTQFSFVLLCWSSCHKANSSQASQLIYDEYIESVGRREGP